MLALCCGLCPHRGTFHKAWIVLPRSCRHACPGHAGLRAREAGSLSSGVVFPTVLWRDKRWLCSTLRPDAGVPSACPSQWKTPQPWL